ncbi:MAG: hypothetical protein BAJALOKI1v1_950003 [Promethearchaeota archaeon]|nr:MAG: hypothetical protein BAJALOKI1v1_950003 [Candidatus Lokiarchaeota archaeon]
MTHLKLQLYRISCEIEKRKENKNPYSSYLPNTLPRWFFNKIPINFLINQKKYYLI